ncbi:hypothetical protein CMV_020221 [Castanea mollissima]|uniref:Uncharacterized protein n=1 Tax=Castanea mollissima TaxID=60419 RepID=A0A8J4VDV2_9ROSI|nr:hypothetical protein CMV_020221 [Castanea mollissima]
MHGPDRWLTHLLINSEPSDPCLGLGGLFLDHQTIPPSFVSLFDSGSSRTIQNNAAVRLRRERFRGGFLSVSLSIKGGSDVEVMGQNGNNKSLEEEEEEEDRETTSLSLCNKEEDKVNVKVKVRGSSSGAFNVTKHLWSGAVSAMVSRTFVAPLERLKLEYMVRGEQKKLFELIQTIAASQGLKGFWKGNFVNILRTAPFKAINFYAYDTYRNQLMRMTGNEETTNFERFVAGAASGITATLLCIPMDTIRTKMVAPGGEALGGVIVFYGVYDILKSAYLHSPEGRKRIQNMKQAATYPFEVVRRQLQMQVKETQLSAMATCIKIVEQGGVPALYAGLIPSLLQVLPSAAISYFVYEFMKIVLKVEST